jgi:tripartite-type tricarboxylate transporter receptor subunit TctC
MKLEENCKMVVARLVVGALMGGWAVSAAYAAGDEWPARPIRMIIPFPPGGSNDIIGRIVAHHLGERLGRTVVVENRAGAGGNLGSELAAKAPADGYTMLIVSSAMAYAPSIYEKLPYDPQKSFTYIAKIGTGPNCLAVHPSMPVRTARDLIAIAKAKPGQINFASAGVGSSVHLSSELFKSMANIDIVHIPFKGGFPAMVDVMSGNSHMIIGTLVQALPQIRSAKLRGIGIASMKRSAAAPDMPTIHESGLPGYEAANYWGLMFPAGVPAAIVNRVDKEVAAVLNLDEVRKRFAADGAETDYLSQQAYAKFLASETVKWAKVVKQAGIKPQI